MFVICFIELIFDDNFFFAVSTEDIELEVADPMFCGNKLELAEAERFR